MSSKLAERVIELETIVKKQTEQLAGLKEAVSVLIGMVSDQFEEDDEYGSAPGPGGPQGPSHDLRNN